MTDLEKIIKGLEQFRADLKPFCGSHADWERFDAGLALLKRQEVVPVYEDKINKCKCGEMIFRYWHPKFCGFCGRELLWH